MLIFFSLCVSGQESKPFMNAYERNSRFDGRGDMGGQLGPRSGGNMGGRGHWVNENRGGARGGNRDDFPPKRRRY